MVFPPHHTDPVADDRTSSADPAHTLRLLWRDALGDDSPQRRGPRRGLSVDAVVSAAIALADEEGLGALTMRRLAERLGVGSMSLYTYVPGRGELIDLMVDSVHAAMPRHHGIGQPWSERVRGVAGDNRALFDRHPWAARVSTLRPPLGPGQMAKHEHELAAFTGSGLDDVVVDDALTYLLTFVRAAARAAADARVARAASGEDDQRWWDAASPVLARVLDEDDYPLSTRIGAAAGAAHGSAHDPEHAYAFGLARVLDALERLAGVTSPG